MSRKVIKLLYLITAFICLALGGIGVALPVLPTTPFLLLASFCFAKGSKRFEKWFLGTRLYKKHLESFAASRAMTIKTKACILLPASGMLILAFIIAPIWHARVLIAVVFVFKYYYFFFRIRTIKA
jgi:uncharacterized membrane protein YbaN (DUF454 family)